MWELTSEQVSVISVVVTAVCGILAIFYHKKFQQLRDLVLVSIEYLDDGKLEDAETKDIINRMKDLISKKGK